MSRSFTSSAFQQAWNRFREEQERSLFAERNTEPSKLSGLTSSRIQETFEFPDDPEFLKAYLAKVLAENLVMRSGLTQLEMHGTHHDLNPRLDWGFTTQSVMKSFTNYFRSMDQHVRNIARLIIDEADRNSEK